MKLDNLDRAQSLAGLIRRDKMLLPVLEHIVNGVRSSEYTLRVTLRNEYPGGGSMVDAQQWSLPISPETARLLVNDLKARIQEQVDTLKTLGVEL